MPTLSVVIPCYNEALTIETIVDAVSKSEIEDLEILVVDDLCLLFIHPRGKWDYSARRKQLNMWPKLSRSPSARARTA